MTLTPPPSIWALAGIVNEGSVHRVHDLEPAPRTLATGCQTVNVANGLRLCELYTLPAEALPPALTPFRQFTVGSINFSGSTDVSSHALTVIPTATVGLTLDPNSNSGAPDHPGFTDSKTPTFDVTVNAPGSIAIDFDGNGSDRDQTVTAFPTATGTFTTSPASPLSDGTYTAQVTFSSPGGTVQASTTYAVDTTPPAVTSMSPNGFVSAAVNQVTINFSEPLDQPTLTASALTLTGPGGTVVLSMRLNRAQQTPISSTLRVRIWWASTR